MNKEWFSQSMLENNWTISKLRETELIGCLIIIPDHLKYKYKRMREYWSLHNKILEVIAVIHVKDGSRSDPKSNSGYENKWKSRYIICSGHDYLPWPAKLGTYDKITLWGYIQSLNLYIPFFSPTVTNKICKG